MRALKSGLALDVVMDRSNPTYCEEFKPALPKFVLFVHSSFNEIDGKADPTMNKLPPVSLEV